MADKVTLVTHAPVDIVPRLAHPGFALVHDISDVSDQQLVAVEQQERRDHPLHHDVWTRISIFSVN